MSLKVYLSGPMTGLPEYNYPAFHAAAAALRALGHTVYNPAQYPHDGALEEFPIRQAFADYCRFICTEADLIVMLPGWQASKGATAERALGRAIGLRIAEYDAADLP